MIPAISITIPTYELGGRSMPMLVKLLSTLEEQKMRDFEVVISDHSLGSEVEDLCKFWTSLPITYIRNTQNRGSCEANLNNAIAHARGAYIKPMLQDDFFLSTLALEKMYEAVTRGEDAWVGVGCLHCKEDDTQKLINPHNPGWVSGLHMATGHNLIGSPSVVMYRNNQSLPIYFDHNLIWLMDCELYARIGAAVGQPAMINDKLVCIRLRHDGITNTMITPEIIEEEKRYVEDKFNGGMTVPDLTKFPLMYERLKRCELLE